MYEASYPQLLVGPSHIVVPLPVGVGVLVYPRTDCMGEHCRLFVAFGTDLSYRVLGRLAREQEMVEMLVVICSYRWHHLPALVPACHRCHDRPRWIWGKASHS